MECTASEHVSFDNTFSVPSSISPRVNFAEERNFPIFVVGIFSVLCIFVRVSGLVVFN